MRPVHPNAIDAHYSQPEYLDVDMGQHVFGLIFDGELTSVPMEEVNNILDYGCGTGKWALDMAMCVTRFLDLSEKAD